MDTAIIVAIVSGGLAGLINIITTLIANDKNNALQDARMEKQEALDKQRMDAMNDRIDNLARKVEEHNNYGLKIVAMETRIAAMERKIG